MSVTLLDITSLGGLDLQIEISVIQQKTTGQFFISRNTIRHNRRPPDWEFRDPAKRGRQFFISRNDT